MGFTDKQRKEIDKCVRNKIDITDDDIMICIMKSKPKKNTLKKNAVQRPSMYSKSFFGLFEYKN
jgi:hypothetical protein